jgi:hypothetical protein
MQGSLAQQIALTTYGNAYLSGVPGVDWKVFFPSNSTFSFCEYVRFVDRGVGEAGAEDTPYAAEPVAWFEKLSRNGVSRLRLACGLLPGEQYPRWFNEAVTPNGSDIWDARWELGDQNRPDRMIWRVTYARAKTDNLSMQPPPVDLADLQRRFAASLMASGDLARRHGMDWFAKAFDNGRAALDGKPIDAVGYDLAPDAILTPDARRLLAAVQASWVFGGMGSWNDVGFEGADREIYLRSSQELYRALNEAVIVAANVCSPSRGGSPIL